MPFQKLVNANQAPAVAGDSASLNPRATFLAGEGSLVSGATGVTVAAFAWATAAGLVSNAGAGAPSGFVGRENQAMVVAYLAEGSNFIPQGRPITLYTGGDFWAVSNTAATIGQKVFASLTTGSVSTGAAGATIAGSVETKWFVGSAGAVGDLIKITTWN